MVNRVKTVKPLENLTLLVGFQNGNEKLYKVEQLFPVFPQFEIFKGNKDLFYNVQVDVGGYGISWNDELDLGSEELWENGIETSAQREIEDIESHAKDTRLAGPSDGKVFDYREMLKVVKALGRPLTEEEAERYRVK